jgi:hypothetical protein
MSMSPLKNPIIVSDPELGTIRLLSSFRQDVRELFEQLIASQDIRCIWFEGHAYVAWDDVAAYDAGEGWVVNSTAPGLSITSNWIRKSEPKDPLKAAIDHQSKSDDAVLRARTNLATVISHRLTPPSPNLFAQTLTWGRFWSDAAFVAANLAGESEAAKMRAAFSRTSASVADGTVNSVGLQVFHRALLLLADASLVARFDEIWSPGMGRLELPNDPERQRLALALLERLTAMFDGARGDPEGADMPRRTMDQYLSVASLVPNA